MKIATINAHTEAHLIVNREQFLASCKVPKRYPITTRWLSAEGSQKLSAKHYGICFADYYWEPSADNHLVVIR
jgi:hypothetical protein